MLNQVVVSLVVASTFIPLSGIMLLFVQLVIDRTERQARAIR